MLKVRLNLKKVVAIATCLAVTTIFSGCDDKEKEDPKIPVLTTATASTITAGGAVSGGNITFDGGAEIIARGVCWATSPEPTISDSKTTDGTGAGSFTSTLTGLTANTTYYVRAYASNSVGTAYGTEVNFTTGTLLPVLTTTAATNITATTATLGGNITNAGAPEYIERGVVYATTQNPTTANSKTTDGTGAGTGNFSTTASDLTASTIYYVRAYATNSAGTAYGSQVSFTTTAATFFAGSGASVDPYLINTATQLAKLAELINAGNTSYNNKYYKLTADIDLSAFGIGWNGGKGWIPIGTNSNRFSGSIDGNNHKVSGLYINDSNLEYAGLFGYIMQGYIQNLSVEGAVTGKNYVGGVAGDVLMGGWNTNCVNNCYVAIVVNGNDYVGGVVGALDMGIIGNCYVTGAVNGNSNVGGVAGRALSESGPINCYTTCTVTGESRVGGVVGNVDNNSGVRNCYATGAVSGNTYVGGIAGSVVNWSGVRNCYATGAVSGVSFVGGVAGTGDVTNCVALNPSIERTTGSNSYFGRVVGYGGTFTNNIAWDGMTAINHTLFGAGALHYNKDGLNKTAAELKQQDTYVALESTYLGWDFSGFFGNDPVWKMGVDSYELPVFYWQTTTPAEMPGHLK